MDAPKKLFFAPHGDIAEDTPITNNDIEYIRKDMLLGWAKEQKARLKQGYKKEWKNDDTLNGGRLMLDRLINKLNSI
jgi:hypothetical protein